MDDDPTITTTTTKITLKRKRNQADHDHDHDHDSHLSSSSSSSSSSPKKVRFDDQATQIISTYSSDEYDRGGIFAFTVLYKVNPSILQPPIVTPPKLSLDTQFFNSAANGAGAGAAADDDDDDDDGKQSPNTPLEDSPMTPPPPATGAAAAAATIMKRPKLTINTTNLNNHHGPSFLTRLSTKYSYHEETDHNDYLVPLSASISSSASASSSPFF